MTESNVMTKEDLVRLRKLDAERTQGSWRADEGDGSQRYGKEESAAIMVWCDDDCADHPIADCSANHTCRLADEAEANAAFIAASGSALPALLAHIEAQAATIERLEKERDEALDAVTEYRFGDYRVALRDTDRWAVCENGMVLNSDGEWEYEPLPSSRSDEFKARTRYPRRDAIRLAMRLSSAHAARDADEGGKS